MASGVCVKRVIAAVLSASGKPITHIYFPLDSFNSSVTILGDEGVHGIAAQRA